MSQVIDLLTNHFKEFTKELNQETIQYAEELEKVDEHLQLELVGLLERLNDEDSSQESTSIPLVSRESTLIDPYEALKNKIEDKKAQLENLKSSVKEKLESRISGVPLVGEIRNEK